MILLIATFSIILAFIPLFQKVKDMEQNMDDALTKLIKKRAELACYEKVEIYSLRDMDIETSCGTFHIRVGKNILSPENVSD